LAAAETSSRVAEMDQSAPTPNVGYPSSPWLMPRNPRNDPGPFPVLLPLSNRRFTKITKTIVVANTIDVVACDNNPADTMPTPTKLSSVERKSKT
jgi:hypothetical protein